MTALSCRWFIWRQQLNRFPAVYEHFSSFQNFLPYILYLEKMHAGRGRLSRMRSLWFYFETGSQVANDVPCLRCQVPSLQHWERASEWARLPVTRSFLFPSHIHVELLFHQWLCSVPCKDSGFNWPNCSGVSSGERKGSVKCLLAGLDCQCSHLGTVAFVSSPSAGVAQTGVIPEGFVF